MHVQAMATIWGEGDHVQCIHPVSGVIAGREDVRALQTAPLRGSRKHEFCFFKP